MSDVTRILSQIEQGDSVAAERLLPLVYDELRSLAAAKMAQENPGHTLQATALVHEAYLRFLGSNERVEVRGQKPEIEDQSLEQHTATSDLRSPTSGTWDSRGHFFAAAAEAMRRILVDQARRKRSERKGGGRVRRDLDEAGAVSVEDREPERVLAIHEALSVLETQSPRKAQLVKLRFFVGMTLEEAAAALNIAVPTAKRDWAAARVWLHRRLAEA
jgi:RNA polymerase sigma factor (TIGR02999 family)